MHMLKTDGWFEVRITGSHHHYFPGFGSEGETLDSARKNAREGLIAHIELMLESREPMPRPTSLDDAAQHQHKSRSALLLEAAQRFLRDM